MQRIRRSRSIYVFAVNLLLTSGIASAMNIEVVQVGNPGNAADTRPNRSGGRVDYTYGIGKYEVTAGQYCDFLNAVATSDTHGLYNDYMNRTEQYYGCNIMRSGSQDHYSYMVGGDWANRPVNFVNWGDAARFVNWLHNGQPVGGQNAETTEDGAYDLSATAPYYRENGSITDHTRLSQIMTAIPRKDGWKWAIPTDDEWYKAAYYDPNKPGGAGYWDYPTRSNEGPNTGIPEGDTGNSANYYDEASHLGVYDLTPVGMFSNSPGPYGTFDQGGNVSEWDEATVGDEWKVRRGGSFGSNNYGYLSAGNRGYDGITFESPMIGFRVVYAVPEPGSLSLLALGGLAILRRRK